MGVLIREGSWKNVQKVLNGGGGEVNKAFKNRVVHGPNILTIIR